MESQLAGLMKDVVITVAEKAGDTEQLFGSVTAMRIAEELGKQGYNIDRHKIEIEQPIRMLGEHTVTVNLHKGVSTPIKIVVTKAE